MPHTLLEFITLHPFQFKFYLLKQELNLCRRLNLHLSRHLTLDLSQRLNLDLCVFYHHLTLDLFQRLNLDLRIFGRLKLRLRILPKADLLNLSKLKLFKINVQFLLSLVLPGGSGLHLTVLLRHRQGFRMEPDSTDRHSQGPPSVCLLFVMRVMLSILMLALQ